MNITGFIKYKILRFTKPIMSEGEFCEKIRTEKQKGLVKKVKQLGINVKSMNINWDYISEQDKLRSCFIKYFEEYINFDKLSRNKYLTINKIRKFQHKLNWNILSRCYKFKIDELKEFSTLLNWQYIFFYQNLTNDNIKKNFTGQMWWLFANDKMENHIDNEYKRINDMVIHKNIRNVPTNFSKTFNKKLKEYIRNREQLKQTLKIELIELIDNFNSSGTIKKLKSIQIQITNKNVVIKEKDTLEKNIQISNEIKTKDKNIQIEVEKIEELEENDSQNPFDILYMFDEENTNETQSEIEDIKSEDETSEDEINKDITKSKNKLVDTITNFLNDEEITYDLLTLLYNKFN